MRAPYILWKRDTDHSEFKPFRELSVRGSRAMREAERLVPNRSDRCHYLVAREGKLHEPLPWGWRGEQPRPAAKQQPLVDSQGRPATSIAEARRREIEYKLRAMRVKGVHNLTVGDIREVSELLVDNMIESVREEASEAARIDSARHFSPDE